MIKETHLKEENNFEKMRLSLRSEIEMASKMEPNFQQMSLKPTNKKSSLFLENSHSKESIVMLRNILG
jgi:hypothetical protein